MTTADAILESFHTAHERAYTFRLLESGVEMVMFQLGAELLSEQIDLPELKRGGDLSDALLGRRELHLGGDQKAASATVYDREKLPPEAELRGPVLIEEPTTTTIALPGQIARVDRFGLLSIEEAR
jgi:N-methylhydantoinase A